jgi:hypothetical protein
MRYFEGNMIVSGTIALIILIMTLSNAYSQNYKTSNLCGVYAYGTKPDEGMGTVSVYSETDSTILVYIEIIGGAPAFNTGTMYERIIVNEGKGLFDKKLEYESDACKFELTFNKSLLTINTLDGLTSCGFGNSILVDGEFIKKSNICPEAFEDMSGEIVFFKKTSPEQY